MGVKGDTVSMNLLLVEMVHGLFSACCHGLKSTALEHEVLGYIYIAVTSAYKLFFLLFFISSNCSQYSDCEEHCSKVEPSL